MQHALFVIGMGNCQEGSEVSSCCTGASTCSCWVLGDMGRFFDYKPGKFCIIRNWIEFRKRLFRRLPKIGNSSCFRFEAGAMNYVYERFLAEMEEAVDRSRYRTEQAFLTHAVGLENVNWWPPHPPC